MENNRLELGQQKVLEKSWYKSMKFRVTAVFVFVSLISFKIMLYFLSNVYHYRFDSFVIIGFSILVVFFISIFANLYFIRKHVISEQTQLVLDATPLCCQLWDSNLKTIECNDAAVKLYGFKDKKEYVRRFHECSPEFQSDGQRSEEKAAMLVKKAFEEGYCCFEWMHQIPDGMPLPAEVTLVRVNYKGEYIVVGYTRDLRDITNMKRQISWLEAEAEKIYYDALTGIYNRRYFDENMNHLIQLLSRSMGVISLLLIDLDYFKKYNDTYGHLEGDKCLKIIAETLSNNLTRADDFVARYGGEEFVVVLPNTGESGARLVAEKLLINIRNRNIVHKDNKPANCVTISIGVTTGKANFTQTASEYIKRADEMMYISKNNGRNAYTFGTL